MSRGRRPRAAALVSVLMTVVAVAYLYPLLLVVINSVKTFSEITTNVVALPSHLAWENFANAFTLMRYPRLFVNTLVVTAMGTAGVVILASLAGFRLSRTRTRTSWVVFLLCVAPMMIPFHSFMIALVKVARMLHLTNSLWGLGTVYWGLGIPLSLFMYHGFSKTVPGELDDCASLDGCGPLRMFFQVIFPLLRPVTVSVIVINAMWMWNDFLLPLLILSGAKNSMTLQLAAYNFFGQYKVDWQNAMAGVLLTITPAIALYLVLQRHIIKGMVAGAVKG
ncbi:MAG TPA: carbohydrate ABC transporter permease [Spirochaetia bacterium]|nr:carbohydrate ABC transporter permease [Spirochaetia bacterium]